MISSFAYDDNIFIIFKFAFDKADMSLFFNSNSFDATFDNK